MSRRPVSDPRRVPAQPWQLRAARKGLLRCALASAALLVATACGGGDVEGRLAEVRALQASGQFNESIEPLRAVLAENPDLPEANHRLGVALVETGQPSLAVWSLEKATASPEYAVQSGLLLASAFRSIQAYEDAVRAADKVLQVDPERTAALHIRAHSHLGAAKLEEALEDTKRLLELEPDSYQAVLLHAVVLGDLKRHDEAEAAYQRLKKIGAEGGDPGYAARGCLALAKFYQDRLEDDVKAEAAYGECTDAYPTDGLALQLSSQFLDRILKGSEATALWRKAVEEAPERLDFRVTLANRLRAAGDADGAEKVLLEATEVFANVPAWQSLAGFYQESQRWDEAIAALDKAIALAGAENTAGLRFQQADLVAASGDLDRAAQLADALQDPLFRELARGRVMLARGDAKGALAAFDAALPRWPNNAVARYLTALAALQLGDFERATAELREALRSEPKATDAGLVLAKLQLAQGDARDAADNARGYLMNRSGQETEALLVGARAAESLDDEKTAREVLARIREEFHRPLEAALGLAGLERRQSGAEAAVRVLTESGLDLRAPENHPALVDLVGDLVSLGRHDDAMARIQAARSAGGERAALHVLRGAVLASQGRDAEAREAHDAALALEPANAGALSGLATLAARQGDFPRAIELYDQAAGADATSSSAAYLAAQLVLSSGDRAGAETRLREIVRKDPGHAGARNDLAWILAESQRDLDFALRLARDARRISDTPDILDTLGFVQLQRDDVDAAIASFQRALEARPDSPSTRYRLGLALARKGDTAQAQAALREALGGAPFPEADAARRELAQLEKR
jgi:tetratricopeptide (TPR) repeat protein